MRPLSRKILSIGMTAAGSLFWPFVVGAEREQPLQEVFQTELVYPQEKNEIQITVAPQYANSEDQSSFKIPLRLEYGLTDAWQMELEWAALQWIRPTDGDQASGIGDVAVGTKYAWMNLGGSDWHAAAAFSVTAPVGDVQKDLGEGFMEYEPSLMLARDFLSWHGTQIFTEAGAGFVSRQTSHDDPADDEPAAHRFFWNSGFFIPVGSWRWVTEINWDTNRWNHDGEDDSLYVTPGLVWTLSKSWELGLGTAVGLNDGADDYRILSQITYEL